MRYGSLKFRVFCINLALLGSQQAVQAPDHVHMEEGNEEQAVTAHEDPQKDPKLEFTSPEFDPALALQTQGLLPPVPDAPVLDNVSKCASLLPEAEAHKAQQQPPSAEVSWLSA
jgi:hypothetical protein